MPVHDWTRVDAGLFHAFHQSWAVHIQDALNGGVLPPEYLALVEQRVGGPIPDVLTLQLPRGKRNPTADAGGVATAPAPAPRSVRRARRDAYARRANRVTVRHRHGEVVAVIEIVSPGNKATAGEFQTFVRKAANLLTEDVNLLVVDLFPPGKHDPDRVHEAIWRELNEDESEGDSTGVFPPTEPVTLVSFDAGPRVMYAEAAAVGGPLPDMPVFLRPEFHVPVPLERTYATTWNHYPVALRELLEEPA
ncbi:MAG: DUF4058 family protein [Gemmataceae bacterium]